MRIWILMLLSILILVGRGVYCAETTLDLRAEIRPEKAIYSLRDSVNIVLFVRNEGGEPAFFWDAFWWDRKGTVSWHVKDEGGKRVRAFFHFDYFGKGRKPSLVEIAPGGELETKRYFDVSALVLEPGSYELFVEYLAPDSEPESPIETQDRIWDRESGLLTASVKFTVE